MKKYTVRNWAGNYYVLKEGVVFCMCKEKGQAEEAARTLNNFRPLLSRARMVLAKLERHDDNELSVVCEENGVHFTCAPVFELEGLKEAIEAASFVEVQNDA